MFSEYILNGIGQSELNTEIRFAIASAKVDNISLIALQQSYSEATDKDKMYHSILKILRALKKEGIIEFFVTADAFIKETTEAVFLTNKYAQYIENDKSDSVYVKLKK